MSETVSSPLSRIVLKGTSQEIMKNTYPNCVTALMKMEQEAPGCSAHYDILPDWNTPQTASEVMRSHFSDLREIYAGK